MIQLKSVFKTYGKGENSVSALKDVNLIIETGKLTAIVGKSGSGKSTLMNMIGALDNPTSGDIFYNEINLNNLNDKELAEFRNKNTGFIFQSFYLEPSFTVLENVCMPLTISGMPKKERHEIARKYLELLDILEKENKRASELSGGQKQRVAIARALVNEAQIILADEPTGNLDSENSEAVMKELRKITELGKTVLVVTHNLEDANKYADNIVEIKDGIVTADYMKKYEGQDYENNR